MGKAYGYPPVTILMDKELKLQGGKQPAQGHTASKGWNVNPAVELQCAPLRIAG